MAATVQYEEIPTTGGSLWTFAVVGSNGEVQARGERYASESNAKRGVSDLYRTLSDAVATGELDASYGYEPDEAVEAPDNAD